MEIHLLQDIKGGYIHEGLILCWLIVYESPGVTNFGSEGIWNFLVECSSILYQIVKKEKQVVAYVREMEIVQLLW